MVRILKDEPYKPAFVFHCDECDTKFVSDEYTIVNAAVRPLKVSMRCPNCNKLLGADI